MTDDGPPPPPSREAAHSPHTALSIGLGLLGCALGAGLGLLATDWLAGQGIGLPALPGALVGLGCGLLSRVRSELLGAIAGVVGLGVGYACIGWLAGKPLTESFAGIGDLPGGTHLPVVIGGVLAWWMGRGGRKRR